MTRREQRSARTLLAVVGLTVTIVVAAAGLVLRMLGGDVWPTLLTDWSLGSALLALSAACVGAVIAIRLPRNAVGWLFLAQGAGTGLVFALRWLATWLLAGGATGGVVVWAAWTFAWVIPLNMTVLALLVALFPHGSPQSRAWRVAVTGVAAIGTGAVLAAMFSPYSADQSLFAHLPNPAAILSPAAGRVATETTTLALMAGWLVVAGGMVRRLRRASGVERAQLKWFVFAAVFAFGTFFPGFWLQPLFVFSTLVAFPAIPVAAGLAILRYRLYDIDRVLNRTLVYSAVTAVLGAAYLVAVTSLRALTAPLAGDNALAVAASTLAVAALFSPVRRRIQSQVDRRFNRARYDAAATVEHVRQRFRDEVDLERLKAELVGAICATMQPVATTLWLRETKR